jgi:N-methylhydantoinase A
MGLRLGIDTGGTFTDLALVDDTTGAGWLCKLPSTPGDPSLAIAEGIRQILEDAGRHPRALEVLAHGTTVATNAVLEGRLAKTAMITTRGFADVLDIARQRRPDLYDLDREKPAPPVQRTLRFEIGERMQYDGSILVGVDEDEVLGVLQALSRTDVAAVAICLLHAYANPEHELQVERMIRHHRPDLSVSRSSAVLPEFREYERFVTTALNAALRPIVGRYLNRLVGRVRDAGISIAPRIMQSNGGIMSAAAAEERPIATLFSGPSAGVIGATVACVEVGVPNLIAFDMGGTSTDVCLIHDGQPAIAYQREIGALPVKTAMVDVHSVGAGGGSIGWVDSGGFLKVGPRSAGAAPGPACYGRGGVEPTVTDANLMLGRLGTQSLLAGRMQLDAEAAQRALVDCVGTRLGIGPVEAAVGIVRIVNANMARAVRVVTIERGHDARELVLIGFGGAGPMHATEVARELSIPRVLIPPSPGILCALGLLLADTRADFSRTSLMPLDGAEPAQIDAVYDALEAEAARWLDREGVDPASARVERSVDARYLGQDYELQIPMSGGRVTHAVLRQLVPAFQRTHETAYGYFSPEVPIQLVCFRVVARAASVRPPGLGSPTGDDDVRAAVRAVRRVYFDELGDFTDCPIYARMRLHPGHRVIGPAIIEQMDATTMILPDQEALVDSHANLIITDNRLQDRM